MIVDVSRWKSGTCIHHFSSFLHPRLAKRCIHIYKGSRKWRTVTVKSVDSDSVNIQQTPGCHVHVHWKPGFFSTPIVPPAATIRASTVTGLWKGLHEVNALLGADFPYSPVKCSLLSHKSKKTIATNCSTQTTVMQKVMLIFAISEAKINQKKHAASCGLWRIAAASSWKTPTSYICILVQCCKASCCCFVLLHLFDFLTVTWHCNILKKLREKKTCRMILNFVCHSTLPMMKRCRGCPKQTKRHKTVHGTAGRCVLNWGSSQWHHSCNDLNQERSIQDITKTFDTAKCLSSIVIWILI